MFFLPLQTQYGYDSVINVDTSVLDMKKKLGPGDLLQDAYDVYLCLGEDISFDPLYNDKKKKITTLIQPVLLAQKFLSEQTMQIIHRMVKEYFSTYKAVVGLFIPYSDTFITTPYFTKKTTTKTTKKSGKERQKCFIFPNLRFLTQYTSSLTTSSKENLGVAILHGGMTIKQRQRVFFDTMSGEIHTLYATNRGLFFNRNNLSEIFIFDPTNWAYSAQSDPRFVIQDVANYTANIYGAKIHLPKSTPKHFL